METTQPFNLNTNDAKEYRRLLAWHLYCQGVRQIDIAAILQVTRGAISQWIKRAKEHGVQALRARKAHGPQPRLTKEQLTQLPHLLQQGASAYGFRGEVWTRARVAWVIAQEFGICYSHAHISKLLRQIGWSQQKPVRRAIQRDDAAIAHWKEERLPALKKGRFEKDALCCTSMKVASTSCPR